MKKTTLLNALLCSAIIGLAGCASDKVEPGEYSGFLKDYSRLKPAESASGGSVMRWVDPNVNISKYSAVYIEPSQLYPAPRPTAVISAQTLQQITGYYNTALNREMGKVMTIASGPGPGVLVIRPAITAVATKNEGFQPYEVLPIALVAGAVNTAAGGRDQEVKIATEAVFIDGGNRNVVAQVVRKGAGQPLENNKTQLTLNDVKGVIDGWAKDMRVSFEKVKAGQL